MTANPPDARPAAAAADRAGLHPEDLGLPVLTGLVESARRGIVVLDARQRCVYANAAADAAAGVAPGGLVGREVADIFAPGERATVAEHLRAAAGGVEPRWSGMVTRPGGEEREVECAGQHAVIGGEEYVALLISDVTEVRRQMRQAAVLAGIASSLTVDQPMDVALNSLARQLVEATDAIACSVVLMGADGMLRIAGEYGLPEGYVTLMEATWRAGAQSPTIAAFKSQRPTIVQNQPETVRADPRYALIHDMMLIVPWRSAAALPLVYRGQGFGAINCYYLAPEGPDEAELTFLTAIANQMAVAVENTRLYAESQEKAALQERQRLARDLHDAVTQTLFSASLIAEVLPRLWEKDQAVGRQHLDDLRRLTRGALAEMRALLVELRPAALTQGDLGELLGYLTEAITARKRLAATLSVEGEPLRPPDDVQVALYRIAQEALNNVAKHAQASSVAVELRYAAGEIALRVADDGRGFDPGHAPPGHFGMATMRERAASIGASLAVAARPGAGTTVTAVWRADRADGRERGQDERKRDGGRA